MIVNDLTDELVDKAYEAMTDELEYWRIIGPDAQGVFIAVRDEQIQLKMKASAIIMPSADVNNPENAGRKIFRLKDKQHAVACLQWHGLRAALVAVKRELAPSASNAALSTGEVNEPNLAANTEEEK